MMQEEMALNVRDLIRFAVDGRVAPVIVYEVGQSFIQKQELPASVEINIPRGIWTCIQCKVECYFRKVV